MPDLAERTLFRTGDPHKLARLLKSQERAGKLKRWVCPECRGTKKLNPNCDCYEGGKCWGAHFKCDTCEGEGEKSIIPLLAFLRYRPAQIIEPGVTACPGYDGAYHQECCGTVTGWALALSKRVSPSFLMLLAAVSAAEATMPYICAIPEDECCDQHHKIFLGSLKRMRAYVEEPSRENQLKCKDYLIHDSLDPHAMMWPLRLISRGPLDEMLIYYTAVCLKACANETSQAGGWWMIRQKVESRLIEFLLEEKV